MSVDVDQHGDFGSGGQGRIYFLGGRSGEGRFLRGGGVVGCGSRPKVAFKIFFRIRVRHALVEIEAGFVGWSESVDEGVDFFFPLVLSDIKICRC